MRFGSIIGALAVSFACVSGVSAQASVCDNYTIALFTSNTAANQLALLTKIVNTVVIGNYTPTANGLVVPGILAPGTVNGTTVSLAKYFTGAGPTTNVDGTATAVNFLDGGGAPPLTMNMPSTNTTTSSRQYLLMTHLYQYFGTLLGCSQQGNSVFPAYGGSTSMYTVHRFMQLSNEEVTYFVQQVGATAVALGVDPAVAGSVGALLGNVFGRSCSPATAVPSTAAPALQSICTGAHCVPDSNAVCSLYTSGAMRHAPSLALIALTAVTGFLMI